MKCCVYIKNAKRGRGRGQTLTLIKHCIGEGRSVREVDDGKSRVDAIIAQGLAGQPDSKNPRAMRDNLLRLNHGGKSKEVAKHVVLSFEDETNPAARRAAARILRRMTFEFLKTYAPGCASLAFVHLDRAHPHCHLIIANSNGERAIHWTPKMIREMQSMTWLSRDLSTLVESGRKGHRRAVHDAYPHARLSLAAELAALPTAELEKISWVQRGSTRVFMYKGRRIRERTIERERNKLYETECAIVCDAGKPVVTRPTPDKRESTAIGSGDKRPADTTRDSDSKLPRPVAIEGLAGMLAGAAKELEKLRGERDAELSAPQIKFNPKIQ
jgi:hypothetical protein